MNPDLDRAIDTIIASLKSGGCVFACGNGGSDAHAGHLVAELVGRFAYDRPPLRAVHLSSGGPVGSCIANDYGWPEVFARQVDALCTERDVLVVFTTSGESANIKRAAACSRAAVVAIVGRAGLMVQPSVVLANRPHIRDHVVRSLAEGTPAIQEQHQAWVHEVARRVEEAMCPR